MPRDVRLRFRAINDMFAWGHSAYDRMLSEQVPAL